MPIPPEAVPWVVGLLASGAIGAAAFLAKRALGGLESSVERMGAKLDSLIATEHAQDMASALLQQEVTGLRAETQLNRDRYHDLAQVTTALRGHVEVLREQVRELRGDTNPRGRGT